MQTAFLNIPHEHAMNKLGGGCTRFNAALNPHNTNIPLPHLHPDVPFSHLPPTPPSTPLVVPMSLDPEPSSTAGREDIDTSFNARMRSYMTQPHQDFLTQLARHSIRSFVEAHTVESPDLMEAYNSCVAALKRWRDAHIRIVTQFVIIPARAASGTVRANNDFGTSIERIPVRGTGGTSLVPLLKIYRNNTLQRLLFPFS
jgi:indoleamine 2,3-dioxygenase